MATAKKGKRSKAPAKKSAAKSNPSKSRASESSAITVDSVRTAVARLDRSAYPEKLRHAVSDVLFASARLLKNALRLRDELLSGSRLDAALLDSFAHRITVLDESESAWRSVRKRGAPEALESARKSAQSLRGEAVSVLRHYVVKDNEVQLQLNAIMEGDGDADLIDDMKALAPLVDAHWSMLDGRTTLPVERGDGLRKAAATLEEARIGNEPTPEAKGAMELRDKAYFYLLEAEREIRECGRHAFRNRPTIAELFADSLAPNRSGGTAGSAPPAT